MLRAHNLQPLPTTVKFFKNGKNKLVQKWADGRSKGAYWRIHFLQRGCPGLIIEGSQCMAHTDFEYKTITILSGLSDEDLEQTILHEIAHIKMGRGGHGRGWVAKAHELGCTLEHLAPYMLENLKAEGEDIEQYYL